MPKINIRGCFFAWYFKPGPLFSKRACSMYHRYLSIPVRVYSTIYKSTVSTLTEQKRLIARHGDIQGYFGEALVEMYQFLVY